MLSITTVVFVVIAVALAIYAYRSESLFVWILAGISLVFAFYSYQTPNNVQSVVSDVTNDVTNTVKTIPVTTNTNTNKVSLSASANIPACPTINGDWQAAFANEQVYEVTPGTGGLPSDQFVYFEGVLVNSNPKDLHSVFEVTKDFVAEQGNFRSCGLVTDDSVKDTILFQAADKKWQNLESQKKAHPIEVTTSDGKKHSFASGERPDWYLEADESNMVCPYTDKPYMENPAGVIKADGTFVGAPGKAGCDFIAISPDGTAVRYSGSIDSFAYEAGTRFFLFDPSWSNEDLATQLNVAKIKNSK